MTNYSYGWIIVSLTGIKASYFEKNGNQRYNFIEAKRTATNIPIPIRMSNFENC